jgi:hypothetical protein
MNYKWTVEQIKSLKVGDSIEVFDRFNNATRRIKCKVVGLPADMGGWWTIRVEHNGKTTTRGTHCCDPRSVNKE